MLEVPFGLTNQLLKLLPTDEYARLSPHLELVSLPVGTILYQPLEPITFVYFPEDALISLVSVLNSGATTETCIVGRMGMVGLPVILGSGCLPNQVNVQAGGSVLKLPASVLQREFQRGNRLQEILLRYTEVRLSCVSQYTACNARHAVSERLARWLLIVQDMLASQELPLTQELIAQMLGVRRASITIAMGALHQAGAIRSKRGKITIVNQEALESYSCECYRMIKSEFSRLLEFE